MVKEVKNPLRAQSEYVLMGSSAKTGIFFFEGHRSSFLDKNAIWDRTTPHLHINCSLHVWGRVQGSQIFKQNSIISICSKVMAFLVISLSLWSSRCPRGPHVIPVLSPSSPHCPHSPQKVPMWSPWLWSPLSLWSPPHVVPMVRIVHTSFLSSPCHPRHLHIIPVSSPSSPHHLHSPQKVPMWSPWLWSLWSPWSPPHVVPVVPMSSTSSPCHLEGPHIIPNLLDTHSTHPPPSCGVGALNQ